jgi:hypothetical protein
MRLGAKEPTKRREHAATSALGVSRGLRPPPFGLVSGPVVLERLADGGIHCRQQRRKLIGKTLARLVGHDGDARQNCRGGADSVK